MVGAKRGWSYLALLSISGFSSSTVAMESVDLILDGYVYSVNSNVNINTNQLTIFIADTELENCLRPNGLAPLNNSNMSLIANNQDIGVEQFHYFVASKLLFLTSESSNLVCDNGVFVDQIFVQGFERQVSPFLIFASSFEN